ncbi:Rid family hydrolase, partial [Bacillus altitudinis]|uniref:Rid family hydrolase n=1 Tax=Bacillus altitudinis TaxID=293387 RepID=UPI003B528DAD
MSIRQIHITKLLQTKNPPPPIRPYSQPIILNNIFYTSPHIPLTPAPHFLNPHIKQQTHQVFHNL